MFAEGIEIILKRELYKLARRPEMRSMILALDMLMDMASMEALNLAVMPVAELLLKFTDADVSLEPNDDTYQFCLTKDGKVYGAMDATLPELIGLFNLMASYEERDLPKQLAVYSDMLHNDYFGEDVVVTYETQFIVFYNMLLFTIRELKKINEELYG